MAPSVRFSLHVDLEDLPRPKPFEIKGAHDLPKELLLFVLFMFFLL